ncbi:MAG: GNAT family N-acetyltransferase [Planctomycetia bacterium]|nr:MAG: GNAT family N-acetyltransferase [Planctomycetia bacterium]
MAVRPVHSVDSRVSRAPAALALRLRSFETPDAGVVAGWARTASEGYWLAPRTSPPLTAEKVCDWGRGGRQQWVLCERGSAGVLLAYGELNLLNAARRSFWLGHIVVDPQRRGYGLGTEITRRLLERAFVHCAASSVTLVVFPTNRSAVRAYQAAGMRADGFEDHEFEAYGRTERLARFMMTAAEWRRLGAG